MATAGFGGVLRPDEFARHVELARRPTGPSVDRWVENHWSLRWDLPEGRRFCSQVLPHPTCALTVELGSHPRPEMPRGETVVVTGVVTKRFDVDIRGWGRVVGVRFRPGGLAALTGGSAADWANGVVAARTVLPAELCTTLADADLASSPDEWMAAAEAGLAAVAAASPADDSAYEQLLAIIADMLDDHSLLTVADVASRHGVSTRALQRLFTRFVGVGPKWVLARYRMHDAVSELDDDYTGTLTELAHRHGWYDQAHFNRDFLDLVGVTPGQYREGRSA